MVSSKLSRLNILGMHFPALATIILVVLHQCMIASSAYFLTDAIEKLQTGQPFTTSLALYLGSMILPFVPGCLSYVAMQAWANAAHSRLVKIFKEVYTGKIFLYRDEKAREKIDSIISRNSFPAIFGYIEYIHGFFSFSLNSLLSLLVIAYLLPTGIWEGYVVSVAGCAIVIAAIAPRISRLSNQSQANFAAYGYFLGKFWDNVTLANHYNFLKWSEQTGGAGRRYYRSLIELAWTKQISNCLLGFVTLIPTAYLIYHAVSSGPLAASVAAAIIVNLTRIFHILNSLGALVYQALEFGVADGALRFLLDAARSPGLNDFGVKIDEIKINDCPVSNPLDAAARIQASANGRFTVRGANGSGKTSFLLNLKADGSRNTFYLPSSFERMIWSEGFENHSTGERMMRVLDEIQKMDDVKMLLLDEWDANLDRKNTLAVDEFLDKLARRKVIVEVRH